MSKGRSRPEGSQGSLGIRERGEGEKPLRCPECRRVIGHVRRVNRIRTLRIDAPANGLVVEVTMDAKVFCECGGMLHWHAGQEAIDELVERVLNLRLNSK